MSELSLIERIRTAAGKTRHVALGIGDDCAIFRPRPGEDLLFTTDMLIEDVHFRRQTHRAPEVGYKALARGLSDIAAMGGTPRCCLVSLALPDWAKPVWVDGFYRGLLSHKIDLAGGDLAHAAKLMCDVIVCGAAPRGTALRRDTAKPGDVIYVSGALGGSALGLATHKGKAWKKHVHPEPRLKLGQRLRERYRATSCMDVSDGLSIDLHRLCKASNVSADLDGELPLFEGASVEQALHGGEDYELLFTLSPRSEPRQQIGGVPITKIGVMRRGHAGRIKIAGFELHPLGYDHFRKP